MDNTTLLTVIGGLIILGLLIISIVTTKKKQQSNDSKENAKEFLNGLSDVLQRKMIEIINDFDFKLYNSLEESEAAILLQIYEALWDYVSAELEEVSKNDILSALALKVLNKDFVYDFISKLINEYKISENIENLWLKKVENINENAEKEDKQLQNEFDNPELYNEEVNSSDLPLAEVVEDETSEETIQDDSEKEYNPETDNSVELVED